MRRTFVPLSLATVGLLLAGCCCPQRRSSPCEPPMQAMPAPVATAPAAPPAPPATVAVKAVPYNKTCPVMLGNPVNPDITTVWQGKVVGFCSESCRAKFLKNPEKYAKNLP